MQLSKIRCYYSHEYRPGHKLGLRFHSAHDNAGKLHYMCCLKCRDRFRKEMARKAKDL